MKVIAASDGPTTETTEAAIFTGAQVWRRGLTAKDDGASGHVGVAIVQFAAGARTVDHHHSSDQVLYVVSGIGKVGNADGEHVISVGDCVIIPADETHWHGAADTGSPMSHLAITRGDSKTTLDG